MLSDLDRIRAASERLDELLRRGGVRPASSPANRRPARTPSRARGAESQRHPGGGRQR
jgi:hypothetical protein